MGICIAAENWDVDSVLQSVHAAGHNYCASKNKDQQINDDAESACLRGLSDRQ